MSYSGTCGTAPGDIATVTLSVTNGATTVQHGTTARSSGTWTATINPGIVTLGGYTLGATQADQAGNTGTASMAAVVI